MKQGVLTPGRVRLLLHRGRIVIKLHSFKVDLNRNKSAVYPFVNEETKRNKRCSHAGDTNRNTGNAERRNSQENAPVKASLLQ